MKATPWVLCAALALWLAFALRGEGYAKDEARRLAAVNDSLRAVGNEQRRELTALVDLIGAMGKAAERERAALRLATVAAAQTTDSSRVVLADTAASDSLLRAQLAAQVAVTDSLIAASERERVARDSLDALHARERAVLYAGLDTRDQRITALEARGRALEARVPSKWAKLRDGLAWAGAGYLAGSLVKR